MPITGKALDLAASLPPRDLSQCTFPANNAPRAMVLKLEYNLENSIDREAWQATVHRVAKSRT